MDKEYLILLLGDKASQRGERASDSAQGSLTDLDSELYNIYNLFTVYRTLLEVLYENNNHRD